MIENALTGLVGAGGGAQAVTIEPSIEATLPVNLALPRRR
jgi:hypothetical protein